MRVKHRILVSAPRDIRLDPHRIEIKRAIVDEIKRLDYEPQEFLSPEGGVGLAAGAGWNLDAVEKVAKRCVGAAIIGLPFWETTHKGEQIWLPTDYCQYEGAVAHAYGLPILAIAVGIEQRIIFEEHAGHHVVSIPLQDALACLQTDVFRGPFDNWKRALEQRRDVFLGYCSQSVGTAAQIQLLLEKLGASVLNYEMDFKAGNSILSEIESARGRCSCGVFLFSEDDQLEGGNGAAAPRDNVVFEAGYFMSSKGAERCLIIREGEAKMPADVGGAIYVHLNKGSGVAEIERRLRGFLESNL